METTFVSLCPHINEKTVCRIFMKFGIALLYVKLSSKIGFCENPPSVRHALLKDVNEFVPVRYFFIFRDRFG